MFYCLVKLFVPPASKVMWNQTNNWCRRNWIGNHLEYISTCTLEGDLCLLGTTVIRTCESCSFNSITGSHYGPKVTQVIHLCLLVAENAERCRMLSAVTVGYIRFDHSKCKLEKRSYGDWTSMTHITRLVHQRDLIEPNQTCCLLARQDGQTHIATRKWGI